MMRDYIKKANKTSLVKELVENGGWDVDDAIEYVYDAITLSKKEFVAKYFN